MLKDIGPLEIEKEYFGKEVLGKRVVNYNDHLGKIAGFTIILGSIFVDGNFNARLLVFIVGIICLFYGDDKRRYVIPIDNRKIITTINEYDEEWR